MKQNYVQFYRCNTELYISEYNTYISQNYLTIIKAYS